MLSEIYLLESRYDSDWTADTLFSEENSRSIHVLEVLNMQINKKLETVLKYSLIYIESKYGNFVRFIETWRDKKFLKIWLDLEEFREI